MRRLRHLGPLLACAAIMPLLCIACSDDGVETGGQGEQATSGGENDWDEADGIAKRVPKKERPAAAAPDGTPAPAAPSQDFRPEVPDARPVVEQTAPPPPPSGPSPWGAPDAACSTPLPRRPPMNASAKSAYQQGTQAAASGDTAAAKVAFERALAADSRAYEAAYGIGVMADRLGQSNLALQSYGKALRIQPDYERAVAGGVSIYLRQGSPSQAVTFAQPTANRYECNLYLQAILADALTAADRLEEAEQVARRALRRDERFVPAMVALAKTSLKRGRTELAESILTQAKAVDGNDPEIHFLEGKAYQEDGRLAQALASYRQAVELRPDYAEARMALGIQYMAGGNYAQAQSEFETVVRLMPTLVAAHLNLGDAYRANKRWQDAKKEFDTALRMQDNLPEAHFNLGLMYMAAGDQFPGLSTVDALQRAQLEFNAYRQQMGPRLTKDDPTVGYMADIERQIDREKKRIEREEAQKKKEAERAARQKAMEAGQ